MTKEDRKQWKRYIAEKAPVRIFHNDETGEWLYSVEVIGSDGFWLESYKTEKAAKQFIQRHQLPETTEAPSASLK
jgi:hypothetical protein